MNKKWVKFIAAMLVALCLCFAATGFKAIADVGNFNSYDSDYSWDSDSSWDSDDYDYSSGSYWDSSDSSSLDDITFGELVLGLVVVGVIFVVYSLLPKKGGGNSVPYTRNTPSVPDMTQSIESQIRANDPDFSSHKFLTWAEEVFVTLQEAWTQREWKKIRPFECEALFNKHKKQLDEYIRNNTINVVERICVNQSMLTQYTQDNNYEYLTVYLKARMNDYIIDATTRQVVKGDPNREFHTNYNLKFMRSLGVKTTVNSGKSTTNCPNCGAPTQITSAGECEYCNSVITTGQHDWVLCDLDSVR